jgi:hypothetical protein
MNNTSGPAPDNYHRQREDNLQLEETEIKHLIATFNNMANNAIKYDKDNLVYEALFFYRSAIISIDLISDKVNRLKLSSIKLLSDSEIRSFNDTRQAYISRANGLMPNFTSESVVYLHGFWYTS